MANPKKIIDDALKIKNSRAKRDQETIKNSIYLKNTPMSTLTQAKIMKKETKSLAKTTSKIAKAKDKSSKLTVDQWNQITNKMGTGKGVGGSTVYKKDKFGNEDSDFLNLDSFIFHNSLIYRINDLTPGPVQETVNTKFYTTYIEPFLKICSTKLLMDGFLLMN